MKAGLEIHQQLNTGKLFCSCPSVLVDEEPSGEVMRKLRAAAGETEEVDIAARHEQERERTFTYEIVPRASCLVELDEEPPHAINQEALHVALQVAKLFHMHVEDQIHVMRKTVVDGSNTSGYQRTALIARDGWMELNDKKITIPALMLEEDAARIIDKQSDHVRYRLDRLGIPLLEIATGPELSSPEEIKEAAAYIGMVLRSTGKAKRGLGTIRQDINISIPEGARTEIKGAQDLSMLDEWAAQEVQRQENLVKLQIPSEIGKVQDVSALFGDTDARLIKSALQDGKVVLGTIIPGGEGILGTELQPDHRVGTDLSDYAKIRAGIGGLFHSDELPKYGITKKEVQDVREHLNCEEGDAFILIADSSPKAKRAMDAVGERLGQLQGVPPEVRAPLPDGTTSYLRPLPGAARMYPETDIPPLTVDPDVEVPKLLHERIEEFEELGLQEDLARYLARSEMVPLFDQLVDQYKNIKPAFIAETILTAPRQVEKQHGVEIDPADEDYDLLFKLLDEGRIAKGSILKILGEGKPVEEVYESYTLLSDEEVEQVVKRIAEKHADAPFKAIMGEAMQDLQGKASGKKVAELVKKYSS